MDDKMEIFNFLRQFSKRMYNVDELVRASFNSLDGLKGFPRRAIETKRLVRIKEVNEELRDLERSRAEYVPLTSSRHTHHTRYTLAPLLTTSTLCISWTWALPQASSETRAGKGFHSCPDPTHS